MPRTKPLPGPRFVTVRIVDVEEALAREVESHAGELEALMTTLRAIVSVLGQEKRMPPDDAEAVPLRWIETQVRKRPSSCEAGAIVERGIHLKIAAVVLD